MEVANAVDIARGFDLFPHPRNQAGEGLILRSLLGAKRVVDVMLDFAA